MRPPRVLTLVSVLLGLIEFGLAEGETLLTVLCVVGSLLAWWFTEGRLGRPLPALLVSTLTAGVLVLGVARLFIEGVSVSVFSEMVMLLVVVKLFDIKNARDRAQVATLSVVLLIGAVLTNSAVLVGMSLLAHLVVLAFLAPRLILHSAYERVRSGDAGGAGPDAEPGRLRGLTRVSLLQAVLIAMVGSLIFAAAPRGVEVSPFGEFGRVGVGQQTGFTDTVALGAGGLISESPTPVLDLRVTIPDSNDRERAVGGPGQRFYLRGAVLDVYQNRRWTRGRTAFESYRNLAVVQRQTLGRRIGQADLIQRITIRSINTDVAHLFTVWQPQLVEFASPTEIAFSSSEGARSGQDGQVVVAEQAGRFEYTVRSVRDKPLPEEITRRPGASFGSGVVRAFTEGILAEAGIEPDPGLRPASDDLRAVEAIEAAFRTDFAYTLDIRAAPRREDPIDWFLTTSREGHCEYFASAMAAACRSVGIHARVISGYLVTEFNEATQSYIVRESNAHAWVEAEVAAGVWRRYDPTPPAELSRIHEPSMSVWARAGRLFDTVEQAWISSVVSYDAESQIALLGGPLRAFGLDPASLEERVGEMSPRETLSAGVSVIVMLAGGVVLFVQRRFLSELVARVFGLLARTGPRTRGPAPRAGATRAEAELRRAILEALRVHAPGAAPLGVRLARARVGGGLREALERGIALYHRVRFGDERAPDEELASAAATIRSNARASTRVNTGENTGLVGRPGSESGASS